MPATAPKSDMHERLPDQHRRSCFSDYLDEAEVASRLAYQKPLPPSPFSCYDMTCRQELSVDSGETIGPRYTSIDYQEHQYVIKHNPDFDCH